MANDAVKLHGFTFTHQPNINVYWEPQLLKHQLADGQTIVYNKGFILKGSLSWGENGWIDQDEYSNVAVMYHFMTATAEFYPLPNSYATRKFNVQFTNEFNFTPHGGMINRGRQFYQGSIEFESSIGDITATSRTVF